MSSYSDTDPISTTRIDVFDQFEYDWKEYAGTCVISELDKDMNAGEGQKFALLPAKMENLRMSMKAQKNSDMYSDGTGNSSKTIGGLQLLVSTTPTTGTAGGINRANFSFWRNHQTSGAQTSTAFDNLRSTMTSIYNLCSNGVGSMHPSFWVTTRTAFQGYEGLLTANERFTDKEKPDAGFKNEKIKFKGAMGSYDNDNPSGNLYFLNEKFLKLVYKKGSWMKGRAVVNPANQTIDVFLVRSMCNMITTNARRLGVVSAIT